jgi:hypothetical protein
MNMKKKICIIASLLIALIISCNQQDFNENNSRMSSEKKISLSIEEYISIAYDEPKEIENIQIKSIISEFLDMQGFQKTKKEKKYSLEIKDKYYINPGINSLNTRSIDQEKTYSKQIPILKVEILDHEKNGLVYISCDERFPDVLAYVPKTVDTLLDIESGPVLLLKRAEEVLLYKARIYNQIRDSLRIATLENISKQLNVEINEIKFNNVKELIEIKSINSTKSTIDYDPTNSQTLLSKIGPYLSTEWNQSAPYNNSMGGSCTDWLGMPTNYKISASIVSTSQILAFFEPSININGTQINWPYLKEKSEIVEPDYFTVGDPVEKRNMIATLMKFCSDRCSITCTCSGSSYYMSNITNFWKTYDIKSDGSKNFDFNTIRTALNNVKLTFCHGKTNDNGGHSWLIDGYIIVSQTGSVSNTNSYVHANMGMGSYYNGYYLVNSNTGMSFDPGFAHFTKDIIMYTNIGL